MTKWTVLYELMSLYKKYLNEEKRQKHKNYMDGHYNCSEESLKFELLDSGLLFFTPRSIVPE